MPTSRRRIRLFTGLTVLLALALAASCGLRGDGGGGGDGEGGAGGDGNTITVLTVQDPFFYAIEELLPEFEEETGIQVNLEGVDYNTLNSRSTNSFMTQQADIDVISPDSMWLSRFVNSDWLLDLGELIERDAEEVQPDDFIPGAVHSLSEWNGGIYTIPVAAYGTVVLYRPDVFEELGIEPPPAEPSPDWTWDEYMDRVEAIDGETFEGDEMHGTVVSGSGPQPIVHMYSQLAASKGVRWFESFPDTEQWDFTPRMDSPENVGAINYFQQLYENSPSDSINYVWFDAGTAFATGQVGMFYWWTPYAYLVRKDSYMGTADSEVVDKYEVGALPQEPGQDLISNVGGYAFGISQFSEKKEDAWTFVKWASSPETQKKMALLPNHQFADFPRYSSYEDAELLEVYDYLPTQLAVLEQGNGKIPRPPIPNYTTLEGDYGQALNQVLAGELSAEEAATRVQSRFEEILENEQYLPWEGESYADTVESTTALLEQLSQ